jgi:Tol biopolymer transport system component
VERLSSFDGPRLILQQSPDDATFYFSSYNYPSMGSILRWDSSAQMETTLATPSNNLETYAISPDNHWLVRNKLSSKMYVRPMSGGDWKSLVSGAFGLFWQTVIDPSSRWVFFHSIDESERESLFRVSLTGSQPERAGNFPCDNFSGLLSISQDGRRILASCFGASQSRGDADLWVMNNFEPTAKK